MDLMLQFQRLKDSFEKFILKKSADDNKSMKNYSAGKEFISVAFIPGIWSFS